MDRSPFSQQRYELETSHSYFLPPGLLSRLEAPRPTYLVGTRGTGKTTLLKAMSSHERLHNESLKRQLGGRPFEGRYIGVYFKLPDTQLRLMNEWLDESSQSVYESVMSLYVDLIFLELLSEAIADLIVERVISVSGTSESALLNEAVAQYRSPDLLGRFLPSNEDMTARSLHGSMRIARRFLERHAAQRLPLTPLLERLPIQQAGKLVRDVSPGLAQVCASLEDEPWRFYVCMDEGENVSDRQQQLVNTIVRLAAAPTYPIVAYVRAPSAVEFIPQARLTRADRELIRLDDMPAIEFRNLIEGISTARIRTILKRDDVTFDTGVVLGDSRLDDLLAATLNQSEAPRARQLLDDAMALRSRSGSLGRDKAPPIIQAFLESISGRSSAQITDGRERRRDASAHRRKRIVAAYLTICHEFHMTPRYASAAILLQLCDVCVRDFLWQMDEIFRASQLSVDAFTNTRISDEIQDVALHNASASKFDRADEALLEDPESAKRLVLALGEITAAAQSWSRDGSHLRSPERGVFVVRPDLRRKTGVRLPLLREAVESGYLQFAPKHTAREWRFRLHTSLAPRFGSSYRGAYYPIVMTAQELNELCYTADPGSFSLALRRAVSRVQGGSELSSDLTLAIE